MIAAGYSMQGKTAALQPTDPAPAPGEPQRIIELTEQLAEARRQIRLLTDKIVTMGRELDGLKKRLTRSPHRS